MVRISLALLSLFLMSSLKTRNIVQQQWLYELIVEGESDLRGAQVRVKFELVRGIQVSHLNFQVQVSHTVPNLQSEI